MAFTPIRLISKINNRLVEYNDLTKPLSAYQRGEHYLVVEEDFARTCLSLSRILTTVAGLDLTKPLSTVFATLLNDAFVLRHKDATVPLQNDSGLYRNRLRVFNPLSVEGYEVSFTSVNTPEIRNDLKRKGFLDDIAITSSDNKDNWLVAINGVFHRTAVLGDSIYVLDGFRTMRLTGRKDITIVDTGPIGGHTIVPLTTANTTKADYQKRAVVTMNSSIQNKTIFAVVDGYFYHHDHEVIRPLDTKHLALYTNKMPLIDQFRHNPRTVYRLDRFGLDATQTSRKYQDDYASLFLNTRSVPVEQLANKDFQYSRLTHYHSFLVVMNNPNLFITGSEAMTTQTPKFYFDPTDRAVSGMVNFGCGLCPSYLLWRDVFARKSIFLSEQMYDLDRHNQTINPKFISSLRDEPLEGANVIPVRFVDYVCA